MIKKAPQPKRTPPSASDIRMQGAWRYLPKAMQPYISLARLDRPIGWWLLLLPGWWIIAGYSPNLETAFFLMAIFMIGAIIMRAAGCVINDLWDRNIDKQVARTKGRPLASGEITPFRAIAFLVFLTLLGLGLLVQLPLRTWIVGASAAPLIILYPLAKRVFGFPQLVLGLTFSWGIPVAASILWAGLPPFGLFLVYAGTVFWVIGYDTIYGYQDIKDDEVIGLKSTSIKFKHNAKLFIFLCYLFLIFSIYLVGYLSEFNNYFYIGVVMKKLVLSSAVLAAISVSGFCYGDDLNSNADVSSKKANGFNHANHCASHSCAGSERYHKVQTPSKDRKMPWEQISTTKLLSNYFIPAFKTEAGKITSPGQLKLHYSPGIPIRRNVKKAKNNEAYLLIKKKGFNKSNYYFLSKNGNLKEAAKNLYSTLRKIKKDNYKSIAVGKVPNKGLGKTINDRLLRASKY